MLGWDMGIGKARWECKYLMWYWFISISFLLALSLSLSSGKNGANEWKRIRFCVIGDLWTWKCLFQLDSSDCSLLLVGWDDLWVYECNQNNCVSVVICVVYKCGAVNGNEGRRFFFSLDNQNNDNIINIINFH